MADENVPKMRLRIAYWQIPRAKPEVRSAIINEIVQDNGQFPNFRQQLDCMVPFTISRAMGLRTDVFSYVPKTGKMAVGYRMVRKNMHWTAEPWAWVVDDAIRLTGSEILSDDKAFYMGVIIPEEFMRKHGRMSASLLLGNLRLLREHRSNLVSY